MSNHANGSSFLDLSDLSGQEMCDLQGYAGKDCMYDLAHLVVMVNHSEEKLQCFKL